MPCLLYSKKPSQNTFFVISADNYFSRIYIYIYLSSKISLTKFCKKKKYRYNNSKLQIKHAK